MKSPEPVSGPLPFANSFIEVPPGGFKMGGSSSDKYVSGVELPRQDVTFPKGFAISAAPVTEHEWSLFRSGSGAVGTDSLKPVVNVSLKEIENYTLWLSESHPDTRYRLPTESEWEYACRGGADSLFPWGSGISVNDANYLYDERGTPVGPGRRTPAGTYPANGFGLFDMLGNVCEWTASAWTASHASNCFDPTRRVIRGGAWDHLPRILRVSWRDWAPLEARYDNLGFRLIKETMQS
ncbi:MAG: formylglycine-generating enzyme family protein [Verrucomicrobiales bacterium]|nr:formylglycine-generating enzyme family protein [Verrucomicrobiales bacterium]